jgi:hypothetical protein
MGEKQLGASLGQFEQRKGQLPKMKLNFRSATIGIKLEIEVELCKSEKFSEFYNLPMKFSIFFAIVAMAGIWYAVKITDTSDQPLEKAATPTTTTLSQSPNSIPSSSPAPIDNSPSAPVSPLPSIASSSSPNALPSVASLPPAKSPSSNKSTPSSVLPLPQVSPNNVVLKPRDIRIDATTEGILNALVSSIVSQESSGNHSLKHPVSGALGMGQVLPSNLPEWTTETFGREVSPEQFLASRDIQYFVIRQKLLQYYLRGIKASGGDLYTAIRRVAAQWYSGQPDAIDSVKPVATGPSVQKYSFDILGRFQNFYPQNYTLKY